MYVKCRRYFLPFGRQTIFEVYVFWGYGLVQQQLIEPVEQQEDQLVHFLRIKDEI